MNRAFHCNATRTPVGGCGGVPCPVRADPLGVIHRKALMARDPQVAFDCAHPAGEDKATFLPA